MLDIYHLVTFTRSLIVEQYFPSLHNESIDIDVFKQEISNGVNSRR